MDQKRNYMMDQMRRRKRMPSDNNYFDALIKNGLLEEPETEE